MKEKNTLLPSEWHKQSAIQLTWPQAETDWGYMLDEVNACFLAIAKEVAKRQLLLVVTPEVDNVRTLLQKEGVLMDNVRLFEAQNNDTWARDHGAITLIEDGKLQIVDFKFNGWGLKFASNHDNLITRQLHEAGVLQGAYVNELNFVLEGGGIESDGKGTMLTTSECLLSPNRNGAFSKAEISAYLSDRFGLKQILWLDHGYLAGDDTDSHVDTLARLCPNDTIVYVQCQDASDEHYASLKAMETQLQSFRTLEGEPYRLIALPMADAIYFDEERLPATYANFLIMNGAVLYPTYGQEANDAAAHAALQEAFAGYELVGIDCNALIKQHGSLHCVTMQFPENVIK